MKIFILILGFILFIKCFFFWLWLWQLKEYHFGRFKAHFEGQAIRKILSSFWRLKFPKFTQKIIVISFSGIFLTALITYFIFSLPNQNFYLALLVFIFFAPLISSFIILFFQIPTAILRHKILQKAKQKRGQFKDLLVIGIAGSYGKTSTKEFLALILAERFGEDKVLKTKEHQNSEMGISQCILNNLSEKHEIFVVEMGAYNKGGIKLLCDIAQPKIGIVTGINEQHLTLFGSMKNLISAEGGRELIQSLPEDGLAIFNRESALIWNSKDRYENDNPKIKMKFCSVKQKTDLWPENIKVEKERLSFEICAKDGDRAHFEVNLLGAQNIENILLAACCAKELGMTLKEISNACQKLKPFLRQMELKKGINGLNIIDATYSANPDGVMAHLDYLKTFSGKKIIVTPCLIELGPASKEIHRQISRKISQVCDLAIITTKDRFKEIKEGAGEKAVLIEKPKEIFQKIKNFCEEGDVLLLESRVPNELIQQLKIINIP